LFIADIATIVIVAFVSLFIRFDGYIEPQYINQMVDALPLLLVSYMLMFLLMHLYTRIWRYAGMREVLAVFVATTVGTAIFYSSMFVFGKSLPRSIYFITWFLTTGAVGMGRMLLHYVALHYSSGDDGESGQVNTLIIGAGDAGATIAREIERYHKRSRRIIGFVDDDMFKHSFSLCMCCEMSNFILQSMDFIKKNLIKINRTLMFLDIHQKVRLFFRLF